MPVAVPLLIGLVAADTTIGVIGQVKAGNAAKRAGEAQAQREEFNANVADLQAEDAIARGELDAAKFGAQVRGLIGTQRAGFAGQNVDVSTGSAVDVQADAATLGELDLQQIRANATRDAWGYQIEAADRRKAADVARAGGQAAQTASRYNAATTALGGASSLLMARYGWKLSTEPRR